MVTQWVKPLVNLVNRLSTLCLQQAKAGTKFDTVRNARVEALVDPLA